MILQETINSVESATDIVDVIGAFIELKKSGSNYKGKSPFSNERTASLMVSPAKGIFKDFSSGKGGNAIHFLMEKEHFSYPEAIHWLCMRYGIQYQETVKNDEERQLEEQKEALTIITEFAMDYFIANTVIDGFKEYTDSRDISQNMRFKFCVGYAPSTASGLSNELLQRGYNWQLAVQASVVRYKDNTIHDYFRHRIIFPIRNIKGRVIGFGARAVQWKKGDEFPKYLNSADSLIYNKSEILYGIYESKKAMADHNECYLVEGYTDVIGFHQIGLENTVAASGTSFTQEQARMIKRFCQTVTVLFDGDSPGIKAALRGIDVAIAEGLKVKVCVLPGGQDPDDFRKGKTALEVGEYITKNSRDFIVFKLQYLMKDADDFAKKGEAVSEVVRTIAKVTNPIQREVYLKECSRISEIDIEPLKIMLGTSMTDDKEFFDINLEDFQDSVAGTRQFLMDQCEARILQYILCYKLWELDFKDVLLEFDYDRFVEHSTSSKLLVKDKVILETTTDGIEFTNPQYAQIFEKAISGDLSDLNKWADIFNDEQYLIAQRLYMEELGMNLTSFAIEGQKTYQFILQSKAANLQNSIVETLLHYKMLHVEQMIADESKKPEIDQEQLFELIDFNNNLKSKLNMI